MKKFSFNRNKYSNYKCHGLYHSKEKVYLSLMSILWNNYDTLFKINNINEEERIVVIEEYNRLRKIVDKIWKEYKNQNRT